MRIDNVILPRRGENARWDIVVEDGLVRSISNSDQLPQNSNGIQRLLLPALCHPHIHLDKPYILTCNHSPSPSHPDYSDLVPASGSFAEALSNTSKAKGRYTSDDLYLRGSQLLASSCRQGVTSLRAYVELDHVTGTVPLTTAIRLKKEFAHLLQVQICAFAQDPIFSSEHGELNRSIISAALSEHHGDIEALGTTPYVEESLDASVQNIDWAINTSLEHGLHLDFHLDYNLEPATESRPMIHSAIDLLLKNKWTERADGSKTILLGHCTQLSTFKKADLALLAETIESSKLPIHFVGLPTSDLFMMGRPDSDDAESTVHHRPRGTLQIPSMIKDLGLSACLAVNNVGNAFTPYGSGDPLQLASFGVGIYQAGTTADAEILYSCVSWRAREAIGLGRAEDAGDVVEGTRWTPMLLVEDEHEVVLPAQSGQGVLKIPAKRRTGLKDVVWDPPELSLRSVIR